MSYSVYHPDTGLLAPVLLHPATPVLTHRALAARHRSLWQQVVLLLVVAVILALLCDPVFAQTTGGSGGQTDITTFLQNIVNLMTGNVGKLIAVLAICIAGISALMGAISLRGLGGIILGVMLIFSAGWIVNQIVT